MQYELEFEYGTTTIDNKKLNESRFKPKWVRNKTYENKYFEHAKLRPQGGESNTSMSVQLLHYEI